MKRLNKRTGMSSLSTNAADRKALQRFVVARRSGQSFREFTDANIFKPLGMTNTERGQVDRLTLREKSSTHVAQRMIPLRAEELTGFVGDYSSDELGTAYTILVRNGELLAQHRRHGSIPLMQTSVRDHFVGRVWFPFHVTFTRDARNQVTGFKLTGERSRNLRFERRLEVVPPKLLQ